MLVLLLAAAGFACDPAPFEVLWTWPADGGTLPMGAHPVVVYSYGFGTPEIVLAGPDGEVGLSVSCRANQELFERSTCVLVPEGAMSETATYTMSVADGEDGLTVVTFTGGEPWAWDAPDPPSLSVEDVEYVPFDDSDSCAEGSRYEGRLDIEADAFAAGGELLVVYDDADEVVRLVTATEDASDVRFTLYSEAEGPFCLYVVHEGADGSASGPSAEACFGGHEPGPGPGGGSCGCATSQPLPWLPAAWLALAGLRRREQRR